MRNFQKLMLGCVLTISLFGSAAATNAQTIDGQRANLQIVGTVMSVNRAERTMEIRERATNRTYKLKVPAGAQLRLDKTSATANYQSKVDFELVMRGYVLDLQVNS